MHWSKVIISKLCTEILQAISQVLFSLKVMQFSILIGKHFHNKQKRNQMDDAIALLNEQTAELRTIGLSDGTSDSENSIRHLELTPNTSENSFRLSPHAHCESTASKHSNQSSDSGCQNETHNGEHIQNDTWQHCDLNILDITRLNCNNRKMDTLDLTVNYRKSSSDASTLSDASSCGTNRSGTSSGEQKKRKDSPKYHSVIRNRLRKDNSVSRSKSFQEQDVRKPSNARFYCLRRNPDTDFDEFQLSKTISHHNIEIFIEDTDANEEPINHSPIPQRCRKITPNERSTSDISFNRHKIRSGHVLSRIFRRMQKFSMGWRKTKNKTRTRGELKFESFV